MAFGVQDCIHFWNYPHLNVKQKPLVHPRFASNTETVASQATMISQLTEMVSRVQQDHKTLMSKFNHLTEQIAMLLLAQQSPIMQCPARGHKSESGCQP